MRKWLLLATVSVLAAIVNGCGTGEPVAGATDTETGGITALARHPDGKPVARASVHLRRADYVTRTPSLAKASIYGADALTDSNGNVRITGIDPGAYCLEVNDGRGSACLLSFTLSGTTTELGSAVLTPCATLMGVIDTLRLAQLPAYVQVRGLERLVSVHPNGGFVLSGVPAGFFSLRIVNSAADTSLDKFDSVQACAGDTAIVSSLLPDPWTSASIGKELPRGGAMFANGQFTITGGGPDIWSTVDGFHFVYQPVTGNVVVAARVRSQEATDDFAKAGIMFRKNLSSGSLNATLALETSINPNIAPLPAAMMNVRMQGDSTRIMYTRGNIVPPYWLRLTRVDSLVFSAISADNVSWDTLGVDTVDLGTSFYAGLAVSSHRGDRLSTAVFDSVSITP